MNLNIVISLLFVFLVNVCSALTTKSITKSITKTIPNITKTTTKSITKSIPIIPKSTTKGIPGVTLNLPDNVADYTVTCFGPKGIRGFKKRDVTTSVTKTLPTKALPNVITSTIPKLSTTKALPNVITSTIPKLSTTKALPNVITSTIPKLTTTTKKPVTTTTTCDIYCQINNYGNHIQNLSTLAGGYTRFSSFPKEGSTCIIFTRTYPITSTKTTSVLVSTYKAQSRHVTYSANVGTKKTSAVIFETTSFGYTEVYTTFTYPLVITENYKTPEPTISCATEYSTGEIHTIYTKALNPPSLVETSIYNRPITLTKSFDYITSTTSNVATTSCTVIFDEQSSITLTTTTTSTKHLPVITATTTSTKQPPVITSTTSTSTKQLPVITSTTSTSTKQLPVITSTTSTKQPPVITTTTSTKQLPVITSTTTNTTKCLPVTVTVTEKENITVTEKTTVTVTIHSNPTNTNNVNCAKKWGQCGGIGFNGPTCCESGSVCKELNRYYSQCI